MKSTPQFRHCLTVGLDDCDARSLYFARGLGTTFGPFWFFARPEVTVVQVVG